jgi:hypothetical protein
MLDNNTKTIKALEINGKDIPINATYWDGYEIKNIKTINGESIFSSEGGANIDINIEITYSDLKKLKNSNKLNIGQQYKITDYVTTTVQEDTKSAEIPFDIIVVADSDNTFNEIARVCRHDNIYFTNSNLNAWQIWYCFENDTNRFVWADTTNGKGVIYRMIDEWGNDCPYDFKNIKFKRGDSSYLYTFSKNYNSDSTDVSLIGACVNNIIGEYYDGYKKRVLNNTILIGNNNYNIFGKNNHNNTISNSSSNIFGQNFSSNNLTNVNYCKFGNNISCGEIPAMCNVTFDNDVVKDSLENIVLSTGEKANDALTKLSENTSNILFTKKEDNYYIISVVDYEDKFEIIYNLGDFENDEIALAAAGDLNIISNPKILFLKYTVGNKTVYINQNVVSDSKYTYQYVFDTDGIKYRKCDFSGEFDSNNSTTEWIITQDNDGNLYSCNSKVLTEEDGENFLKSNEDITIEKNVVFKGEVDLSKATINGDNFVKTEQLNTTDERIREIEKVSAYALSDLKNDVSNLHNEIINLQNQIKNISDKLNNQSSDTKA